MSPNLLGFETYKQASDILKGKEANVGGFRVTLLVTGLKMCYCVPLPFLIEISSWAEPQILPSPRTHRDCKALQGAASCCGSACLT